jgi:hypothetical protein
MKSDGAVATRSLIQQTMARTIDRVAVVTDCKVLVIVPKIADFIAHTELKMFESDEKASAPGWLRAGK